MSDRVIVAVDAHGGDGGSAPVLEGVACALQADPRLEIVLCGRADVVLPFAADHERCSAHECGEPIGMGEHPAEAVKAKADSSIVQGCKLVKAGQAQAFFSAGSTGACLVAATLHMGRLKGVKRPALGIMVPALDKPTFLLDVGANSDCKVEYLAQFAKMGSAYMRRAKGVDDPKIALLNIGDEPTKGSQLAQEAHSLMSSEVDGFCGNCEPSDLVQGDFDVVVTDGFSGNVCLKTMESTAKLVMKLIKGGLTSSASAKLGALLVKGSLSEIKERMSPEAFGGSPLLGVKGVCVVGHGASTPLAIRNGILAACDEVRSDVASAIEASLAGASEGRK